MREKRESLHRVGHKIVRIGNHVVVGNPKVGYQVAELSADRRFEDREEAVRFAIEQEEVSTDPNFVDVRRRGW
jgi:hypothetical protein